jgi:hypothetical protein
VEGSGSVYIYDPTNKDSRVKASRFGDSEVKFMLCMTELMIDSNGGGNIKIHMT